MGKQKTQTVQTKELDSIVDAWFYETFHNIGLETSVFNRFNKGRDALKARLKAALTKEEENNA